jgi:dihydrofolate reductase
MGRLVLTMHVSADGFISNPDGSLWPGFGWPDPVQARLNSVYETAGSVVYGRGIYQAVVPWWSAVARGEQPDGWEAVGPEGHRFARMLAALPKSVVSTTLPELADGTRVIRSDPVDRIRELVVASTGDVVLLAGGRLVGELVGAGLLRDVVLISGTVFIGAGRPLLGSVRSPVSSTLVEFEAFPPTTAWARYRLE